MPIHKPSITTPSTTWAHYLLWERVKDLISVLPSYFNTELLIKGLNVTEVFSLGSALSTVIDTQVVSILNKLRHHWDPQQQYSNYLFVRQSQTFPDVLLKNSQNNRDILLGIELKSWYVMSKEGEPSFRYTVTPAACAEADLLVIIPWLLSDVISGTPQLLPPYLISAKYAAEYRNNYWQTSRTERGLSATIYTPPPDKCHPYPLSKEESSDEAEADKGGNFGRIARSGILDEYLNQLKAQDYLGIHITHWITFFKAISETKSDEQITQKLESLKAQIQSYPTPSHPQQEILLDLLDQIEKLWKKGL